MYAVKLGDLGAYMLHKCVVFSMNANATEVMGKIHARYCIHLRIYYLPTINDYHQCMDEYLYLYDMHPKGQLR